jgi:hypothetical protein
MLVRPQTVLLRRRLTQADCSRDMPVRAFLEEFEARGVDQSDGREGPPPRDGLARLLPMLHAIGISRLGDITGLDRIGIPVVQPVACRSGLIGFKSTFCPLPLWNGKRSARLGQRRMICLRARPVTFLWNLCIRHSLIRRFNRTESLPVPRMAWPWLSLKVTLLFTAC